MSQQIWFNGKLIPAHDARVSVYDHGLLYGDGVFEGIRSYHGRVFKLATHLRRLMDSAKAIRLSIPYSLEELAHAVRQTVQANGGEDRYIRLCVTRGVGTLGLNPQLCQNPCVFIIVDTISLYPPQYYQDGMAIVTASTIRNHPAALSPRIKSMNYLNNILAKIEALDANVSEAVMLNHLGYVAECTGDNLFIVKHSQPMGMTTDNLQANDRYALFTPPLGAGVLEGVTMDVVIELAQRAGIRFEYRQLTRHDLYIADEMFLTGTAAEVIPVTQIDGRQIGSGQPGPVTRQLMDAFHQLVDKDAPED